MVLPSLSRKGKFPSRSSNTAMSALAPGLRVPTVPFSGSNTDRAGSVSLHRVKAHPQKKDEFLTVTMIASSRREQVRWGQGEGKVNVTRFCQSLPVLSGWWQH